MLAVSVVMQSGYRGDRARGGFTSESPSHCTAALSPGRCLGNWSGCRPPRLGTPVLVHQRPSFDFHSCSGLREDSEPVFPVGGEAPRQAASLSYVLRASSFLARLCAQTQGDESLDVAPALGPGLSHLGQSQPF